MECEVRVDGMRLEHVSQHTYSGYVLDEIGTDEAQCRRNLVSGRRVVGDIRSLVCRSNALGSCMRQCSRLFLCMKVRQ